MRAQLTEKAMREMNRKAELEIRALQILELVVAEWESDPMSVQCFDLCIVEEAKKNCKERKKLGFVL